MGDGPIKVFIRSHSDYISGIKTISTSDLRLIYLERKNQVLQLSYLF